MKVSNGKTIRRLGWRSMKAARTRNLIAVLAIALTTVLFTSLFTIAMSINDGFQQSNFRQVGGFSHGGFKYLTAKTAPAPLHPKGTSAPTPWAWALLLSPPCGARRDPLSVLPKEKRAVHGPKRKAPGCALVQWPSALKGGRRIGACSDLALPSGTLGPSAIPSTAVPWRMVRKLSGCKNAFDQLLFPRVPLRYALPGRL